MGFSFIFSGFKYHPLIRCYGALDNILAQAPAAVDYDRILKTVSGSIVKATPEEAFITSYHLYTNRDRNI
jgi:hypothetical protein